ncbi:hypothetical protein K2X33_12390 [bacterium]|nr:hypothetical protein [bacterium]
MKYLVAVLWAFQAGSNLAWADPTREEEHVRLLALVNADPVLASRLPLLLKSSGEKLPTPEILKEWITRITAFTKMTEPPVAEQHVVKSQLESILKLDGLGPSYYVLPSAGSDLSDIAPFREALASPQKMLINAAAIVVRLVYDPRALAFHRQNQRRWNMPKQLQNQVKKAVEKAEAAKQMGQPHHVALIEASKAIGVPLNDEETETETVVAEVPAQPKVIEATMTVAPGDPASYSEVLALLEEIVTKNLNYRKQGLKTAADPRYILARDMNATELFEAILGVYVHPNSKGAKPHALSFAARLVHDAPELAGSEAYFSLVEAGAGDLLAPELHQMRSRLQDGLAVLAEYSRDEVVSSLASGVRQPLYLRAFEEWVVDLEGTRGGALRALLRLRVSTALAEKLVSIDRGLPDLLNELHKIISWVENPANGGQFRGVALNYASLFVAGMEKRHNNLRSSGRSADKSSFLVPDRFKPLAEGKIKQPDQHEWLTEALQKASVRKKKTCRTEVTDNGAETVPAEPKRERKRRELPWRIGGVREGNNG